MEFSALIRQRFSVLDYDRRPSPRELVGIILDAGLAAPHTRNASGT